MCGIDWCGFTWQAFATLVTGFAAVGGATFVGLRQHGLVRRQAEIADRQAQTAETAALTAKLKLRADLFDKRMEIYHALKKYLKAALSSDLQKIWEATDELSAQLERATFLFSQGITKQLEDAIRNADELHDKKHERIDARAAGEDVTKHTNEIKLLRRNLRDQITNLAATLGDEMKLYSDR